MCLEDLEIRQRLATNRDRTVRLRAFEFARWARDELGLCPVHGDDRWQAIDIQGPEDETFARIFPKEADLLKVANVRGAAPGTYGTGVPLTDNNEWSFSLASERFDAELARDCLRDQVQP
jgi:hypothetical protein